MANKELTERQKKFCDYYVQSGNAKESYIKAGYKATGNAAEVNASKLLRKTKVKEYLENINNELKSERIADMKEIKEFWTNLLRDEEYDINARLKASDFIAKTNGAFIDKKEIEVDQEIELNLVLFDDEEETDNDEE